MPIPDGVSRDLKLAGDIIDAPQGVIDKISSFISHETRGIVIQISNMTDPTHALETAHFSSGDLKPSVLAAPVVQAWQPKKYIGKPEANAPRIIGAAGNEAWETGEWSQTGTNRRPQIKGFDTGFLMLLEFTALYIQIDPRLWTGICQLLARLMIGTN